MLMVISPAKTLDFETPPPTANFSQPDFLDQSRQLVAILKTLAPAELSSLMGISDALGLLNAERYQRWQLPFGPQNSKPAVLAFMGDVYTGIDARHFQGPDFTYAQQHLRILSGLYGVLRPLDLMQPYRLEMGTRLANGRGANLYDFWGARITEALNAQLQALHSNVLVNLASNEYFKAVHRECLAAEVITPIFKERRGGKYQFVSFYAKTARGLMAAYAVRQRLQDVEQLQQFDSAGYAFNAALSSTWEWVFTRDPQ